jgi:hypothetical protein
VGNYSTLQQVTRFVPVESDRWFSTAVPLHFRAISTGYPQLFRRGTFHGFPRKSAGSSQVLRRVFISNSIRYSAIFFISF